MRDDGLLTASEVAQLKLDADWVILSACNTASADGTPGAQGLSGLAKAFFYAGSRALLVSHWPVVSDAAVAITTRMLAEAAKPGVGRAEAHRRAMMAMIDDKDRPHYAHPLPCASLPSRCSPTLRLDDGVYSGVTVWSRTAGVTWWARADAPGWGAWPL